MLNYLPAQNVTLENLRRRPLLYTIPGRTERFRNTFFPFCMSQWNNLDSRIRDLPLISRFKAALHSFLRPKPSPTFKLGNNPGFTFLKRLRVGFSHLREHKFRHGFLDTLDPFCNCRGNFFETTEHFLLHCSNYSNDRTRLFNNLLQFNVSLIPLKPSFLCKMLLHGDVNLPDNINREIFTAVIRILCESNRFSGPLL